MNVPFHFIGYSIILKYIVFDIVLLTRCQPIKSIGDDITIILQIKIFYTI